MAHIRLAAGGGSKVERALAIGHVLLDWRAPSPRQRACCVGPPGGLPWEGAAGRAARPGKPHAARGARGRRRLHIRRLDRRAPVRPEPPTLGAHPCRLMRTGALYGPLFVRVRLPLSVLGPRRFGRCVRRHNMCARPGAAGGCLLAAVEDGVGSKARPNSPRYGIFHGSTQYRGPACHGTWRSNAALLAPQHVSVPKGTHLIAETVSVLPCVKPRT